MFAAVSNPDWLDALSKLFVFLTAALAAWVAYRQKKTSEVVDVIHGLVNSRMGSELLISMVSARTLSKQDPTPENIALAKAAEDKYLEHQQKQAAVDAQTLKPPTL